MESLKEKIGYTLRTKNKTIGKLKDYTIDEQTWSVKHMVVHLDGWGKNREILVPAQILKVDLNSNEKEIGLQVPESIINNLPEKKEIPPVSLEQELYLSKNTGWLSDLKGKLLQGPLPNKFVKETLNYVKKPTDNHLRSLKELKEYSAYTKTGEVGQVEDFILNPNSWQITHILVYPKKLYRDARILVSTQWVTKISWANSEIDFGINNKQLHNYMKRIPNISRNSEKNRIKEYFIN